MVSYWYKDIATYKDARVGTLFKSLSTNVYCNECHTIYLTATTNLTNAVTCTGEAYEEIAKLVDDQPRNDWEHLGDTMHDYRGMLAGWPGIIQVHSVSF